MRKILALIAVVTMIFILGACGSPTEEQPEEQISYEIALVTDAGLIMDGGYSEVAWNAISTFGAENGLSHKYYKAATATEEAYKATIDDAIAKGAKIVIADGYTFEDVIYDVQSEYKDVKFLIIDAEPIDEKTGETKIGENTCAAMFSSEEAGYLVGFAAVENGYTQLGFIGEAEQPIYKDYGYGFVQGANAAAANNGITVNVRYHSCNESDDRAAVTEKAEGWYEDGVEVIFACGNNVEKPIISAAELKDGKVIGSETDKSGMSDTVMTSAIKAIPAVLDEILHEYARDKFPGGEVKEYDFSTGSILLDMSTSQFVGFNEGDYKAIGKSLKNKNIEVLDNSVGEISDLGLYNVAISEEK